MIAIRDTYSADEFAELVARETGRIELKRGASVKALQDALVAFSNADGGVILIGVTDDRVIVGCELTQGVDDRIHDAVAAGHNVGSVTVREIQAEASPVVAVEVQPRLDGFAQTSDGRLLVRQGARNRALVGDDVRRFLAHRQVGTFETTESDVALDDVDAGALEELAQAFGWGRDTELDARLRERNLLGPGSRLTIAGALVLTDPVASMSAAKFAIDIRGYDDTTSTRYVRRDEIRGTLPEQVRTAARLVSRDVGTEFFVLNVQRREVPRLPADVIREVIANAVAHRSYEEQGMSVVIEVRPDRVTVRSPGPFPSGVRPENLRSAQKARNPVIINVLRRFELAEDTGRGIDLIEDEMSAAFLLPPTFEELNENVVVTLPIHGLISAQERAWIDELENQGKLGASERLLLVEAARGNTLSNVLARKLTGLDSTEVRRSLTRLRDEGLLVQHGARGGSTYTLGDISPAVPTRKAIEQAILTKAASGPVTNQLVREVTGMTRTEAGNLLRGLVEQGRLVQEGERRGTAYRLPN